MAVMALMALIELGHTSLREHRVCDAEPLQQGLLPPIPAG